MTEKAEKQSLRNVILSQWVFPRFSWEKTFKVNSVPDGNQPSVCISVVPGH